MLTVENLQAAYGAARVLFDVSFGVGEGEMVTLLGRNGMGKTTTISAIMGLLRASGGNTATCPFHSAAFFQGNRKSDEWPDSA